VRVISAVACRVELTAITSSDRNPGNYSAWLISKDIVSYVLLSSHFNDLFLVDRSMSKLHLSVGRPYFQVSTV